MAGKATRAGAELVGDLEAAAVARRQQLGLAVVAAAPHRTDGVDHPAGREAVARRRLGVAGRAPAEQPALGQQLGSGGAVDGAVDAAATEQRASWRR